MPNTIPAIGEAVAFNSTRRSFLAGVAVAALPASTVAAAASIVPAVAVATEEHPMTKARRLANELSETLRDFNEHDYVIVKPAGEEFAVLFANRSELETQEEKCARLLHDLLVECRKLQLPRRSMFGRYTDLPLGGKEDTARYAISETDGELMTVFFNNG